MSDLLTVSQTARLLEAQLGIRVRPRLISDLFYQRRLPDDLAPVIGGRRLIPSEALPEIRAALSQDQENRNKAE